MTGRNEDAEDIVQETFIRAYRQLGKFEARSNVSTWLHRIGVNCAIDYLRTRRREVPTDGEMLEQVPMAGRPTTEDLVFAGQIDAEMRKALDDLSDQERAAFLLRHYQGCSIEDICLALGLETNAAKHAVFRGVKKMRAALRPLLHVARDTRVGVGSGS